MCSCSVGLGVFSQPVGRALEHEPPHIGNVDAEGPSLSAADEVEPILGADLRGSATTNCLRSRACLICCLRPCSGQDRARSCGAARGTPRKQSTGRAGYGSRCLIQIWRPRRRSRGLDHSAALRAGTSTSLAGSSPMSATSANHLTEPGSHHRRRRPPNASTGSVEMGRWR